MEKVKVREQGKEGENDNKISLKIQISFNKSKWLNI